MKPRHEGGIASVGYVVFLQDLVLTGTVALLFTDLPWVVYAAMAAFQVAAIYLMWPRRAE